MIYSVKHREQSDANNLGEYNGAKRSGGEGAPKSVRLLPLPRRQRPLHIKPTIIEEERTSIDIETYPAPTKYCQHRATHRDPRHTHTLLKSQPLTETQPPSIIPSLPHNTYTPWQPPGEHSCSPSSLPRMEHHDSSKYSHTNQHSRAPYSPAYSRPSLPPKRCELVL